jgi:SAM-dependent methyltransferase
MPERRRTVAESNSQRPGPRRFRRRLRARIDDLFFKNIYRGTPPWDIGRPQAEFVALAESGAIRGEVLDIGCGTGDIALHLASRGFLVCGVDFAPLAIKKAREKARQRGLDVEFIIDNALEPTQLTRAFDTVIDSGLFHTFGLDAQPFYVATLARLVRPGADACSFCASAKISRVRSGRDASPKLKSAPPSATAGLSAKFVRRASKATRRPETRNPGWRRWNGWRLERRDVRPHESPRPSRVNLIEIVD